MSVNIYHHTPLFAALGLAFGTVSPSVYADDSDVKVERISIIGAQQELNKTAGSVTLIDEIELEKFEYDDIARVLATVPGVNIRQEDGYGLRPNIGFRGVTPERSKKINIMEDGILIGPAPYSAPAAYYFPMTSRMTAVEVTKGPSTIKYGPNTVAGALNLVTRQVPDSSEGAIDVAYGSDNYGKAHGHYGNTVDQYGFLVEGLHVQTDGFKELDGGDDTGFKKSDFMAKFNVDLSGKGYRQLIELKASYSEEESDETYLGLTDDDFSKRPYRRYSASQLDNMDWDHSQLQLTHHFEVNNFNATTRIYRNDFSRAWFKLNGFTSSQGGSVPTLQEILTHPTDESNQAYYQVLTGQQDSTAQEILVLGNNDRDYYSQGIQVDLTWTPELFGLIHTLDAGVRYHEDEIERNHTETNFFMRSGVLENTGEDTRATSTNTEKTDALSAYVQDSMTFGDLTVSAGVRWEHIEGSYQNRAPGQEQDYQDKTTTIWLPSISAFYALSENSGIFGGVHEGFVPTSPIQDASIDIEESVNYELGWRYSDQALRTEFVGFFSDYSNLKESCSISAGCDTDLEFSGGEVDVYGLEASIQHSFALNADYDLPWSVVYTYTDSEFKSSFYSDFEQWGFVEKGDPVPYLAEHMLTASVGLTASNWQVALLVSYSDEMPETAQQQLTGDPDDATLAGVYTDDYINVDIAANYDINSQSRVYAKVDNLFDDADITSRRPYGARPTMTRTLQVGYKYKF
ncbi:TonB-dependent receptor family protein [Echinimonas agarilytica]|uniref:TonB-dependent receptor n=1 Tax=Echinimonas agarilytica TaxID=1215918 RepID=A0AA41W3D2_9GAMM|nr:TonB-dependent receptor [Echinimonas agarilytica]MCM2678109.1 TonB-dependent receptor [Echinimonas agarilytica]